MKKILIFFIPFCFLFFTFSTIHAQTDSLLSIINDLSEDETYLADLLLDLQENPVNLNDADRDDLLTLPLLTPEMADSILAIRNRYGKYKNKRQIRNITGPELYDLIKNYITASQKKHHNFYLTHRNAYKIEKVREIETGKYTGDALNDYTRVKYIYDPNTVVGFVTQKDVGEKNYLDHFNFSLHYKNKYWNILLGNYYLKIGEGLSYSTPYGNQKSIYLAAVFRQSASFARSNLTSSESGGKYGIFIQNNLTDAIALFSFYSKAKRDAQLSDGYITGIKYDGLHRSESELQSKNRFSEINRGGGMAWNIHNNFQISALASRYNFSDKIENSETIIGEEQKRRQYFNFGGSELSQISMAYSWNMNNMRMSGEVSSSDRGQPGFAQSLYYSRDNLHLGIKYWYLNKNFQTMDGRSFDNSNAFPNGVKGFFTGITLNLNKNNTLSAFKKTEQKLWRTYFDPLPTDRDEWLVQWDYQSKPLFVTSRIRKRTTENFDTINDINQRSVKHQTAVRVQLSYQPEKNTHIRTRWEHTWFKNLNERGTLIFQELNYVISSDLSLSTRFTFFNTVSYDSRIYEYERDLPGAFSNIALFGNGSKLYFLLKWEIYKNYHLWLKWRYVSKNEVAPDGQDNQVLGRDIRMQIKIIL